MGAVAVEDFKRFFLNEYEAGAGDRGDRGDPGRLLKRAAEARRLPPDPPGRARRLGPAVVEYLPYLEAAAMGPGSGRMLVHVTNGVWRPLAQFGDEQHAVIVSASPTGDAVVAFCLTEKTGGTGRDLHSCAWRDGDAWLLTGEKHLITFADRADLFLIVAASDDRAGQGLAHRVPRPSRHDRLRDRRHPAHDGPPRHRPRVAAVRRDAGAAGPAASARSVRGSRWR